MASFASLVYGKSPSRRAARSVMSGGRASRSRSSGSVVVARPAQPATMSLATTIIPAGMRFAPHRGIPPWETGCMCDCHGNADRSGRSCDVKSCVDVVSAC
jgi:hypothetical protein